MTDENQASSNPSIPDRAFTKEEEERKRDAYLKKNPSLHLSVLSAAITFAERHLPPHLRRNQPRVPHQKFE